MTVTFTAANAPEELRIEANTRNAVLLGDALGITIDFAEGTEHTAQDFMGRVLLAQALSPVDEGMPAYEDSTPGSARWFEGGRRPGYLQERLAELHTLATWATEHAAPIWIY